MSTPLVSIILPTFHRPDTTKKAIESVISQTYGNWELIVVDDGSKDDTWQSLLSEYPGWKSNLTGFGKNTKSIQLHQIIHRGVSGARNFGVERSFGKWICFLDSDDLWLPEKISKQINYHKDHPEIRISQTNETWIKNGNKVKPLGKHKKKEGDIFQECLELCLITPSSVILGRELWEEAGGFDERLQTCEDYDFWIRITAKGEWVGLLEEELMIRHGGHSDQLSGKYNAMERFRLYSQLKLWNATIPPSSDYTGIDSQKKDLLKTSTLNRIQVLEAGRKKRNKDIHFLNYFREDLETGRKSPENFMGILLNESDWN
ncbi:glycosyltransferase family 2 protein [Leptospira ilyithenensis]|uniref:Glycosyltransferase n=1 Tax=Leptospira ilyithenensis TaxID=2484901 RepID=A0A4V3JWT8_9LEPT|nr:glycosyltransferase [Leptospira ilyithenensis]TGN08298.1 glycosyltransferase [Leptospira ilyithenensis]